MKGTIIVLNKGVGYHAEGTYEEVVDSVYHVDIDYFDVWIEFGRYQVKFYRDNGLEMSCNNAGAVNFIYPSKSTSNEKGKIQRKYWKINKDFKKELSMRYYLEEVLKAEKVNFTCGFDFEK